VGRKGGCSILEKRRVQKFTPNFTPPHRVPVSVEHLDLLWWQQVQEVLLVPLVAQVLPPHLFAVEVDQARNAYWSDGQI
jgi:hypothetical protein